MTPFAQPNRTWIFLCRLEKGGHRLFWQPEAERIAIADNSGLTPDDTDDGALWLDPSRQESFVLTRSSSLCTVALVDDAGTESRTGLGWDGALKFAELFDVVLEVRTDSGALVAERPAIGHGTSPIVKLVRDTMAAHESAETERKLRVVTKTVSP